MSLGFELSEYAEETVGNWMESADLEEAVLAIGFSAKFRNMLTPAQLDSLTPYERKVLDSLTGIADETAFAEEVAAKI